MKSTHTYRYQLKTKREGVFGENISYISIFSNFIASVNLTYPGNSKMLFVVFFFYFVLFFLTNIKSHNYSR